MNVNANERNGRYGKRGCIIADGLSAAIVTDSSSILVIMIRRRRIHRAVNS
jgi:hypothetical protein